MKSKAVFDRLMGWIFFFFFNEDALQCSAIDVGERVEADNPLGG